VNADLLWLAVPAAAAALGAHALLVAPHDLRVTRVDAPVPGLGPAFDGYRIAALADLHHWPNAPLTRIRRAVEAANDARPDAIALLGDYSVSFATRRGYNRGWYERAMTAMAPVLGRLHAPDGVYAVIGNHDHYYDAPAVCRWLASLGARPLVNAGATIRRDGEALGICGVDDVQEGIVDLAAATADIPSRAPTVVLSHNPDAVLRLPPDPRVSLVLAGHTHGGQYAMPWIGAPMTQSEVCTRTNAAGWVPNPRAPLYVSRGIGAQTPGRMWSPPEVVIVTLRAA
jgi:hypothetical protein